MKSLEEALVDPEIEGLMMGAARACHNSNRWVRKMSVMLVIAGVMLGDHMFDKIDQAASEWLSNNYVNDIGKRDTP